MLVKKNSDCKTTQKENRRRRLRRRRQRRQNDDNRDSQSEAVLSVSTDQSKKGNVAKSIEISRGRRNERKQSHKHSLNQKNKNEKRNEKSSDKNHNINDEKNGTNQRQKNDKGIKKNEKRGRRRRGNRKTANSKDKRQDPFLYEEENTEKNDDKKFDITQFPILLTKSLDSQQSLINNDTDDPSSQKVNPIWSKVAYTAHVKNEMEQDEKRIQEQQQQNGKDYNYRKLYTLVEKQNENTRDKVVGDKVNVVLKEEKDRSQYKHSCNEKTQESMESHQQNLRFQRKLNFEKLKKKWWNNVQQQKQNWEQTMDSIALSSSSSSIQSSTSSFYDESSSSSSSFDGETVEVSNKYWDEPLPIHCAIWNNDEMALEKLLSSEVSDTKNVQQNIHNFVTVPRKFLLPDNDSHGNKQMSILQYAVYLDRPVLLRIILANLQKQAIFDMFTNNNSSNYDNDCLSLTPLMLACQKGYNECVKTLLRFVGPKQIFQKIKGRNITETLGNTAMHYACENGQMYTIELLLNGCSKNNNQLRSILCAKNKKGQTPMHLAASNGHTSTITFLLQSFPLVSSKVLQIADNQGMTPFLAAVAADNEKSTDTMMHLLMWKNKNYHYLSKDNSLGEDHANNLPCPLSLAVSICSLEKTRLLLDFDQDPFDLDGALLHVVKKYDSFSSDVIMELVQILIEVGANPYNMTHNGTSSLLCVLQDGQVDLMEFIIQKFHETRKGQDIHEHIPKPFLVRSSNFQTQIQQEEEKTQQNVRECVIKALCSYCYHESNKYQQQMHCCRILLQRPSFEFKEIHYDHLIERLINMPATASNYGHYHHQSSFPMKFHLEANYTHYDMTHMESKSTTSISPYIDRPQNNHWSSEMIRLSWVLEDCIDCNNTSCKWLRERVDELDASITTNVRSEEDMCYLIIEGCRYPVHRSIISKKSMKMQAAIRFADNQQHEQNSNQSNIVEVPVDLSLSVAKLFISHCYHGSMIFSSQSLSCDLLLELSIIAEEYICPSLMQECEMRLLSQRPHSSCFCWYCCDYISSNSKLENLGKDSLNEVSFQCTYHIAGSSKLLTAQTTLDVYSVAQQLTMLNKQNGRYKINVVINNDRKVRVNGSCLMPLRKSINPFEAVQTAAMKTVLMHFQNVLKSDSFQSNLHDVMLTSEKNESQTISPIKQHESEYAISLLDTCVSSLANSQLNQILYKSLLKLK